MPGAPALTAMGAFRGGAGLVRVALPVNIYSISSAMCPCATYLPLPVDNEGCCRQEGISALIEEAKKSDVVAVGPGMTTGPDKIEIITALLGLDVPLVIDADGLNCLAKIFHWDRLRKCPAVLTPHPGEFARLTGETTESIQAARREVVVNAVIEWTEDNTSPLVALLKGQGTVVTNAREIYINDTGNPGMATGGSGDVLTGLIAALIAQCDNLMDATKLAVWIHGMAGDLAVKELTEVALTATDLIDNIPNAMALAIG